MKKITRDKKKSYHLYLTYKQSNSGGEICAGQENDPWPTHETEYIEWYPTGICREPPPWSEELEVSEELHNGESAVILVVRYSSGSTFGHSEGNWSVLGIFATEKEAEAKQKEVTSDGYTGYKCWVGYFESLEGFEIHSFSITDTHTKHP